MRRLNGQHLPGRTLGATFHFREAIYGIFNRHFQKLEPAASCWKQGATTVSNRHKIARSIFQRPRNSADPAAPRAVALRPRPRLRYTSRFKPLIGSVPCLS